MVENDEMLNWFFNREILSYYHIFEKLRLLTSESSIFLENCSFKTKFMDQK